MKKRHSRSMLAVYASASLLLTVPFATAQDIGKVVNGADTAARAGDWDTAYPLYKEAVGMYSLERMVKLFQPEGASYLYYRHGQAAQILGKKAMRLGGMEAAKPYFEEAIKRFKECAGIGDITNNQYKNKVVYMMGQCQQALKDYEGAISSYDKFKRNYNSDNADETRILKGPGFGKYTLDKAMCYFKQKNPNRKKGAEMLTFLMQPKNKIKYKIPDAALVGGFQAYCMSIQKAAAEMEKNKDKSGLDSLERELISFMGKNRDVIALQPYLMYAYTFQFLKLSIEMKELGMHRASFVLQSFLPNTIVSKEDMDLKIKQLGQLAQARDHFDIIVKEYVAKDLGNLQKHEDYESYGDEGKTYMPHEMSQNLLLAQYYEDEGNSRAAFAIYEMIELYHNDFPKREEMLFHLVRTSYNIGAIFKTTKYGQLFIKDFPKSERISDVEEYMLTSLFVNRKYEKCIEIAETILPTLQPNTKQHDIALYCLGGSYYYLGESEKASAPLAEHVKLYGKGTGEKESQYAMATQYWDGSNDTYLNQWERAAGKLDKFLADYPNPSDNAFFPAAKYDRANCHTQLEEYEKSIEHLDVVCSNHKDSPIIDRAYALRGNDYQNLEKFDEAFSDYKEALALAQRAKNDPVEAEVLNYLVLLLGDKQQKDEEVKKKNFAEAIKYYDIFWAKYSKGAYKAYVAVSGLPALTANGRGAEGLANLKQVIMELAAVVGAPGMDEAINTYTEEFIAQDGNDAEKLRVHYNNDFKFRQDQVYARSLVKMSLVDVYLKLAEEAKKREDVANEKKWRIAAKGQLDEVAKFDLDKLNHYTLITIGDAIRRSATTQGSYNTASKFYEKVIANAKNKGRLEFKNEAIFGFALCLVETRNAAKLNQAIAELTKLKDNPRSDKKTKEKAHYNVVTLTYANDKKADTIANGTSFIDTYPQSRYKVIVRKALGDAYFDTQQLDKAKLQYESIALSHTPVLKYSGPAILRIMEICQSQGQVYVAYKAGASYVKLCGKSFDLAEKEGKMPQSEIEVWQKVKETVEDLETEPEVTDGIAEDKARADAERR